MDYQEFIAKKRKPVESTGFHVDDSDLNNNLFDWQARIVKWSLMRGRSAIFADCGLGKTLCQLNWAEHVFKCTQKPVVIHTPVGVRKQTLRESEKFRIDCEVEVVDEPHKVIDGINIINYEKLHKFEGIEFGGVVLDESSVLKGLTSKTRQLLTERYAGVRFKLACTATPAPNDHMELGNHAEFLGVCESVDMLNRFFYHDSGDTAKWVLMGHARKQFWAWVAQWAVCIAKPSDIGGRDDGYDLPALNVERHFVSVENEAATEGFLFNVAGISATSIHDEKRQTNESRCKKAAELLTGIDGPAIIWCDTNYEADELKRVIPEAIEVRGSLKDLEKEQLLFGFSNGEYRVLISKGSIAGVGMNWQHCNNMIFAGLGFSFEVFYQSIRRCWRFGQTKPVNVHIILAESESAINSVVARKEADFDAMRCGMSEAMRDATLDQFGLREGKTIYKPSKKMVAPSFIHNHIYS
jgi:superfamily II DNA or RNA helicase